MDASVPGLADGACAVKPGMADQEDVQRIALSLDGVAKDEKHFGFSLRLNSKRHGLV